MEKEINDLTTQETILYNEVKAELLKYLKSISQEYFNFEWALPTTNEVSNNTVEMGLHYIIGSPFDKPVFELLIYKNCCMDEEMWKELINFLLINLNNFHYPSTRTQNVSISDIEFTPYNIEKFLFSLRFTLILPTK